MKTLNTRTHGRTCSFERCPVKACETQLKKKGIDVGAFVVDGKRAFFKQCTRQEVMESQWFLFRFYLTPHQGQEGF